MIPAIDTTHPQTLCSPRILTTCQVSLGAPQGIILFYFLLKKFIHLQFWMRGVGLIFSFFANFGNIHEKA